MTAPLTPPHPPHRPSASGGQGDNPWQAPPNDGDTGPHEAAVVRDDIRDAVIVFFAVAVLGVGLGLLWLALAPSVPLISDGKAVFLRDSEGEEAVGADGTFALLGLAFGALSAVGVFVFRRRGGIALVVALALGGLLGAFVAWGVGTWFGPTEDVVAHAKAVGAGVVFDAPLELNAKGALLAWPVAAMVVHLLLTSLFGPRDPEPLPD
ncbi:DUF2567 domain-containing protein [Streptomyces sp. NPDC005963]|uniref:DUF2567 domain-containing protein n=1 Tax=Streptomyces sp. NPDC005963 TaxID=3156721 RepID=UPI0033CA0F61